MHGERKTQNVEPQERDLAAIQQSASAAATFYRLILREIPEHKDAARITAAWVRAGMP